MSTKNALPFTSIKVSEEAIQRVEAKASEQSTSVPRVLAACVAYLAHGATPVEPRHRKRGEEQLRRVAVRMSPQMLRARDQLLRVYPSWSLAVEDAIARHLDDVVIY